MAWRMASQPSDDVKFKARSVRQALGCPVVEKAYAWHAQHEDYFRNTENLAQVAMLQSEQTSTYYVPGAAREAGNREIVPDAPQQRAGHEDAARGYYQALVEARIPFNLVDERQLAPEYTDRYQVLVLANVAALSDAQCGQIRDYVNRGGSVVATHESSLYDEWGKRRANFGLAELFGCDFAGKVDERMQNAYMAVPRSRIR